MKGIVAVVLVLLLAACGSLPEHTDRVASYTLLDNAETQLAQNLKPLLEANEGLSGFYTLGEGEGAFVARLRMIKAAQKSVDTQYYIWHDDLTGRIMHSLLFKAADRGVRVRMLLDDMDTAGKDHLLRTLNAHPNIEVRVFNPFANRDKRIGDYVGDTRRINRRMHNKTITVDNSVTLFGGRNIGDEYFAAAKDVGFGDMDALAVGPIAGEVSSQFDLYWNSDWAYAIESFSWDAPITEKTVADYRKTSAAHIEEAKGSAYAEILQQFDLAAISNVADLEFVWSKWLLAYDQPSKVEATKVTAETHLAPKLKQGMDQLERDLIIVSPYFVPGESFTGYLTGLVDRGVRIRILTNSLQANDVSMVHAGYMRYRKELVAGGVELYEFKANAAQLSGKEKRSRIGASKSSLHAKFFGFDETYLFIGSFNLDARSVALNTELGAYFSSPAQAKKLSDTFDDKAIQLAYRVELDEEGDLQWVTRKDGQDLRFDKEPDTTWWKRFSTRVLSLIVPESQL